MSTIDFSSLELDEDTKAKLTEVMSNESVSAYLTQSVENRENAVLESSGQREKELKAKLDEFRETNIKIKKELEAFEAIDMKEYARLKALGSDVASASETIKNKETEWAAIEEGYRAKLQESQSAISKLEENNEKEFIKNHVRNSIMEWNMKNPHLKVVAGTERVILADALDSYKILDGKVIMQDDGKDYTNDSGFGTTTDWLGSVVRKKSPWAFEQVKGSGASGSNGGGAATKPFSEMSGAERLRLKRDNPEEFNRIKDK